MKKSIFIFLAIAISACIHRGNNDNSGEAEFKNTKKENGPVFYVANQTLELGKIKQGEKANCVFKIENRGKSDLIIHSVSPGCGCTATDWDPAPIKPGKTSQISITFNSTGKIGKQIKKVFVNTNAQEQDIVLSFTCEVEVPNK